MTSTLARGAGSRSLGEPAPLGALAASPALVILLLAGLGLRLTIAYVLFPASGFATDIVSYASWALTLGHHGPAGFYANAGFSDYPPGYLYLLWPIGLIAQAAPDPTSVASALVKLPAIVTDIVVGYLLYRLVRGWTWPGRNAESLALLAAGLYVLNPVSFYDSALWGQSDAVGALVLLLGLAALIRGNSEGATAMAAMAALIKPQFGVVLVPLVGVVLLKRHLVRPGSGPRHRPWAPAPLAAWLDSDRGPVRLLTSLAVGLLLFHVVALPFGLDIPGFLRLIADTAGGYEYLSVNAFNPWALVGSDGSPSLASGLTWSSDTVPILGPLPAVAIGATLLAAGFLWTLGRAMVRDDRWTLIVALTTLTIAFFLLPTRVHERYLFPAVAILPLLAVVSRGWLAALVLLSVGALINMHAILTWPIYATESVADLPLGATFRTLPFIVASVVLQAGIFAYAAWQLRPSLATSPDGFERAAREQPPAIAAAPQPAPGSIPAALPPASSLPLAPVAPDWVRGPGVLDQLAIRFTRPPLRHAVDSSARRERPGRLDRLDALVLVLLVVSAAAIRGFRSDEPFGMYFDEVYHARTATEFLQDWEYGEPHSIYEYTHPHLAKYAMAGGIAAFGGNQASGSGNLGAPVTDAVIETRWAPPGTPGEPHGDRLYVATGTELRVLDLASRAPIGSVPASAVALAVDPAGHLLYVADADGSIRTLDTTTLDLPVSPSLLGTGLLEPFTDGAGPVERLIVTDISVITLDAEGLLRAYDRETGSPLAERPLDGASDLVATPWTERVVVDVDAVGDLDRAADDLARWLGADTAAFAATLAQGPRFVVLDAYLDDTEHEDVAGAIDRGALDGVSLAKAPMVAVAGASGVTIVDGQTLDVVDALPTAEPATGLTLVERGRDEPTLYVPAGDVVSVIPIADDGPTIDTTVAMPGAVRDAAWNEPANLVHVVGTTPDGSPTVYVIEEHANAVFADAELPFDPRVLLLDLQPDRPSLDRGQALAFAPDGRVVSIDVLREAAAWRFPGILMGALTAGLIYLLARLLVERRVVGLFAAALVLAEGMLFANARIAMNDVYVTTFILLAAVLYTPVYTGQVRRGWLAGLLLLGTGTALGLGLASKWVALYAIGGLVLLVLLRSALGRWLALAGFVAMTAVLGAIAIRAPDIADPNRNWTFLVLMLVLTMALAAGIVRRPLPVSRAEVLVGGAIPILIGTALLGGASVVGEPLLDGLVTAMRLAAAGVGAIVAGVLIVGIGTRWRRSHPATDRPRRGRRRVSAWLTPARAMGLGWLATLSVLTVLPIAIYVASYAPWVELGNQWIEGVPAGHSGQTLAELTLSMYRYHDDLRAAHAASSPWWAWPIDLKPVWFYQESFAGPTTGLIHDTGNLVVLWLGIPAMAFLGWAAWRRRSLSLAIVVILWLSLWLPWVRIDRATFQYHVYASLPFLVIALAYLLAELWRGPGPRTWFLTRLAAAVAILGIPLLWLARQPLCRLAGTAIANPNSESCGEIERSASISPVVIVSLLVLAVGASLILWLVWRASMAGRRHYPSGSAIASLRSAVPLSIVVVALATVGGVVAASVLLEPQGDITLTVSPEILALLGLAVLAPVAWLAMRARDARRLVLGILAAAAIWFVVWYPNIAGLPLPSGIAHVFQGVLPTWNWGFQFAVNLDPPASGPLIDGTTLVLALVAIACAVGAAVTARSWGRRPRNTRGAPAAKGSIVAPRADPSAGG